MDIVWTRVLECLVPRREYILVCRLWYGIIINMDLKLYKELNNADLIALPASLIKSTRQLIIITNLLIPSNCISIESEIQYYERIRYKMSWEYIVQNIDSDVVNWIESQYVYLFMSPPAFHVAISELCAQYRYHIYNLCTEHKLLSERISTAYNPTTHSKFVNASICVIMSSDNFGKLRKLINNYYSIFYKYAGEKTRRFILG